MDLSGRALGPPGQNANLNAILHAAYVSARHENGIFYVTWYKTFSEIWSGGVERSGAHNYEIKSSQAVPRPMLLI